jgi:mannose-6-phosphate isomerase-like protein (cupin superfamily)
MFEVVLAWHNYLHTVKDWQQLIEGISPREDKCGLIYEIPNPIDRPNESFAIADMRNLAFCQPHYHPETEIYFIVQGSGIVVIGPKEHYVQKGSVLVIPPNIAHFTIPKKDLIMAIVNTPPFNVDNYYPLYESNMTVKFDKQQFDRLLPSQ